MNFQKYFLQREEPKSQSTNNNSNNINNNDTQPKKHHITKNQQYEIDRKKFFKENRERAKPLLSQDGLLNRRYENNFEWGHNTIINFRGVKGTDWTRDHGFTYADDFNTLERDVDTSYQRPNIKNCRYCLNSYPDTEPHKVLENEPTTEIGGCIKCHPEQYVNNHNEGNDDFYPMKSEDSNPTENISIIHNTRKCHKANSNNITSKEKITCSESITIDEQPNWNNSDDDKKYDKSENILIDQNNTSLYIGDYHCKDRTKSHLNKTGFHSDEILPAGIKSVNNTVCRLKNVTYDNTSNIFFNDEFTAHNLDKEKPSYKGLIRYSNQSFIPFNHVEYNPNPDKEHEFDNKVYKYPNKMRINPEFDYNDTKNNYKVPFNNSTTYDEFIKNNKHAPQHMYYKEIGEQLNHVYVSKKKNNESKPDNNNEKNIDNHYEAKKEETKTLEVNKATFEKLGNESPIMTLSKNNEKSVVVEQEQEQEHQINNIDPPIIIKSSNETKIQNNGNNINNHQGNENKKPSSKNDKSNSYKSCHHQECDSQTKESGYYFVYNYDNQNKPNNYYYEPNENGETFEEACIRISKEQGFLNGYLPNKYQAHIESVENPMYFDRDIEQKDVETQRRLNKIVHDPLKESIENSLARQYDDLYKEKEENDRQCLYNKVNRIRYDGIENWEDFISLNAFTSKLKGNFIPKKMTEKQKVNEDNIYFGVYPIQHKRLGEEPPFDKTKINKETPLRFLADYGIEFDKGVMKCREPPFNDCNCWINETSRPKTEQPLPYLYASRNIKFNELKNNTYISPNLKRLLEQDYRNTGKIGSKNKSSENGNNTQLKSKENSNISTPASSSSKNKIQFHDNSYINKDDLNDLIINQKDDTSNKSLAPVKAPKRITCRDRSHNYVIYDYESAKAKVRNNNRIKNLAAKQKVYKSSIDILG